MRALEGLPFVERVTYLPDRDDFEITYRSERDRFEAFARAVNRVILLPGVRRWIERRFGRNAEAVCAFHPDGPPAARARRSRGTLA
jgi:hypothetical protein